MINGSKVSKLVNGGRHSIFFFVVVSVNVAAELAAPSPKAFVEERLKICNLLCLIFGFTFAVPQHESKKLITTLCRGPALNFKHGASLLYLLEFTEPI